MLEDGRDGIWRGREVEDVGEWRKYFDIWMVGCNKVLSEY